MRNFPASGAACLLAAQEHSSVILFGASPHLQEHLESNDSAMEPHILPSGLGKDCGSLQRDETLFCCVSRVLRLESDARWVLFVQQRTPKTLVTRFGWMRGY